MMTKTTRFGTFALVSINFDSVYLTSNSAMYIIDNVINASTQEGYKAFVFYCDRLDLYDNSSLNIIRNTIHVDGWVGGALIYVAQTDVYGINSSFNVMGNSLSATSNLTISAFHVELQRGDKSSVFSLSSNFINISSTDAASTPILIDNPINLNLKLDNNQIHYSSETVFSFYDAYRLSGFSIRGNTIQATKPITANIAQIDIFSIFPNGSYVVANNKVTAPSVTTTDSPLLFVNELRKYVDYYYEMDNSTLVHHCGNSLPWSTDPTSEQLFSSEVLDIVIADTDLCGQTSHSKLPSLGVSLGVLISFLAFIILH
eukprot:GILI01017744.1.p1 GENE.GILI01017744.1~~GILI01017744.1.p1  ORF type:complete len:315 (+),score=45.06 GILI01017744.1:411-1355(+)